MEIFKVNVISKKCLIVFIKLLYEHITLKFKLQLMFYFYNKEILLYNFKSFELIDF